MGLDFQPYLALAVTTGLVVFLVVGMLVVNALLGPRRRNPVKGAAFECGSVQADDPHHRVNVRFYLVAIFFLAFDVEIVMLVPWAVLYRDLLQSPLFGTVALGSALVFVGVLALGLAYVWRKGALDWAFDAPEEGDGKR